MPKGVNKDGSPKTRPSNAGRKEKDGRKVGPFKLATDVADILDRQVNKTAYLEDAVREKEKK